jgi:hypothetical protein
MTNEARTLPDRHAARLARQSYHPRLLGVLDGSNSDCGDDMKTILHPVHFYRLVKYHLFSGLTFSNALKSAHNNLNRSI